MWPILYGDQLRQARLDDWIFQGLLDVEHLPARRCRREPSRRASWSAPAWRASRPRVRLAPVGRARARAGEGRRRHAPGGRNDRRARLRAATDRRARARRWPRSSPSTRPSVRARRRRARRGGARLVQGAGRRRLARALRHGRRSTRTCCCRRRRGAQATAVVPVTMAGGDLRAMEAVLAVGFRALKDFSSGAAADDLRRTCRRWRRARTELHLSVEGRAGRSTRSGCARAFDEPRLPSHAWPRSCDLAAASPARRSRCRPCSGSRRRARFGASSSTASGGPVFEVPTLPPSVPGMRVSARCARRCGARAGTCCSTPRAVGAERADGRVTARARRDVGLRERATARDWVVLATRRLRRRAASSSTRAGRRARDVARPAGRAACPSRVRRGSSPQLLRRAADGAAPAWRSTTATAAGRRPARERARRRRDARRRRAVAREVRRRAQRRHGPHGGRARSSETDDHVGTRDPVRQRRAATCSGDLMRDSLDHCVKCTICETYCPVAAVTPLFPGPKYVGPAGRALPGRRRAVAGRLAGLLLGLRHLHAGVPAGRAHRRDQLAGAREAEGRDGRQAARPAARAPDAGRPARDAGRPDRELVAAQPGAPDRWSRRRSASTATRRCRRSPGARSRRWARRAHLAARPSARSSSSTAAATNYYEPGIGEKAVEVLEHNGFEVDVPRQDCCGLPLQSNGLFDDARALRRAGWPRTLAPCARARRRHRRRPRRAAR